MKLFQQTHAFTQKLFVTVILSVCFLFAATGCSDAGSASGEKEFLTYAEAEAEYLETLSRLDFPENFQLPDTLNEEDTGASFQAGYGDTKASNLWEYAWMQEWVDTYLSAPEKAQKALDELEKAFDMPYMGTDRCDDATRNYLKENIDKAKAGDPSGFQECIRINYAD